MNASNFERSVAAVNVIQPVRWFGFSLFFR